MNTDLSSGGGASPESIHAAETALARLGCRKVAAEPRAGSPFSVADTEAPQRTFPVFLWDGPFDAPPSALLEWRIRRTSEGNAPRAILVVPSERAAEAVLAAGPGRATVGGELRVLVMPAGAGTAAAPHWHALVLSPRELLDVATGVVVGLFRRAQASEGSSEVDFQEMLRILKHRFRIDLHASLGVDSDEAVLYLLYQLAQKYAFAPGDPSSQIHTLVLRPTGPAARLPWFAA